MKSLKLVGLEQFRFMDVPDPEIVHPDDVLIRMRRVGICGSDVHYYNTGRIGSQVVNYPFAVGHEGAGTVVKTGFAVHDLPPGTDIAIEPGISCGTCDQCLAGRPHTCRKLVYLGCPGQLEGCLCDYLVMPRRCCFPLPPNVSLEEGALVEPLSIGVYAVKRSVPMKGMRIGVFGCGPIGLSVILPALAQGADRVYAFDKIDSRLKVAEKAGACAGLNPDRCDPVAEVKKREPLLLDVLFECCGDQPALDQCVSLVKPGGKIMLIGIPTKFTRFQFDVDSMRRKEICVQNIRRQNGCVQPAIDMIADGSVNAKLMITHRFPFSGTPDAFRMVADYSDGVVKAMVNFDV